MGEILKMEGQEPVSKQDYTEFELYISRIQNRYNSLRSIETQEGY